MTFIMMITVTAIATTTSLMALEGEWQAQVRVPRLVLSGFPLPFAELAKANSVKLNGSAIVGYSMGVRLMLHQIPDGNCVLSVIPWFMVSVSHYLRRDIH